MENHDAVSAAQLHADNLHRSLAGLIEESRSLRADVQMAERTRRRESRFNLLMIGMLSLFVLCVLAVAWQNNAIAARTDQTNRQITSCTVPGGKCYEEGRARTGDAIAALLRTQIAGLECARLYPGESGDEYNAHLESCVYARVAALTQQSPNGPVPMPAPGPSAAATPTPAPTPSK